MSDSCVGLAKESDTRAQICDPRHQKDEANIASGRVGAHPSTGKRAAVHLKYSALCRWKGQQMLRTHQPVILLSGSPRSHWPPYE